MSKASARTDSELAFSVKLSDCRVDTFRAGGKGGQHQNKTSSGVRIVHPPSGAVGEARDERSQLQNKRTAFKRMTQTGAFRMWMGQELLRLSTGKTPEQRVAEDMRPENLRVEGRESGKWEPIDGE